MTCTRKGSIMFRPEMKQPKNAAGAILIFIAIMAAFITYEYSLPFAVYYAAAALWLVGTVLIVIPGRAADHDHQGRGKDE